MVNHGVPERIISEAMSVLKEFFNMPADEKASSNPSKSGWVYTGSTGYTKDGVHLWRDNIKLPCHPLEECMQRWPEKPTKYR